jgi:hypothetical protein
MRRIMRWVRKGDEKDDDMREKRCTQIEDSKQMRNLTNQQTIWSIFPNIKHSKYAYTPLDC